MTVDEVARRRDGRRAAKQRRCLLNRQSYLVDRNDGELLGRGQALQQGLPYLCQSAELESSRWTMSPCFQVDLMGVEPTTPTLQGSVAPNGMQSRSLDLLLSPSAFLSRSSLGGLV